MKVFLTLITLAIINYSAEKCSLSISLLNAGSEPFAATKILRKSVVLFSAIVNSDCERALSYDYRWTLHQGHDYELNLTQFRLSGDIDVKKSFIKIPAKYLPYGNYTIKVGVTTLNGQWESEKQGFFRVISSNLVPIVEGGTRRTVYVGDELTMNASRSYDPDFLPDQQKFRYSWSCESEPATRFCESTQPISKRPFFVIPGHQLLLGTNYHFYLNLTSFDVTRKPQTATQIVTPTDRDNNVLNIVCIKNCEQTVNPMKSLELKAQCRRCEANVTFKWDFSSDSRNRKQILEWDSETLYGRMDQVLSLKTETLVPREIYQFSVAIVSSLNSTSWVSPAFYDVKVKSEPSGGNCALHPLEGIALVTNFRLLCSGFVSDNPPLTYSFYYNWNYTDINLPKKINNMTHFSRGVLLRTRVFPHTDNLILSPGDPKKNFEAGIVVVIRDGNSMSSQLLLMLKVKPPENYEASALKQFVVSETGRNASIYAMASMGNIEGVYTDVIAVGHYINTELPQYVRPVMSREEYAEIRESLLDAVLALPIYSLELSAQASSAVEVSVVGGEQELSVESLEKGAKIMTKVSKVIVSESVCPEMSFLRILESASASIRALSALLNASVENEALEIVRIDMDEFYHQMEYDTYEEYTDDQWNLLEDNRRKSGVAVTCVKLMDMISMVVLNRSRSDEGIRLFETKCLRIWLEKAKTARSGERDMGCNRGSRIHLPDPRQLGLAGKDDVLNTMLLDTKKNPYFYQKSSDEVNSNFLLVEVADKNLRTVDFRDVEPDFEYLVERRVNLTSDSKAGLVTINDTNDLTQSDLTIHRVAVSRDNSNILVIFANVSSQHQFVVSVKYGYAPSISDFNSFHVITVFNETERVSRAMFPANLTANGSGFYYLAFVPFTDKVARVLGIANLSGSVQDDNSTLQISYSLSTYQLRCLYWSHEREQWLSEGCRLGDRTKEYLIHCVCRHLSAFSAGVLIAPNYLDISATLELFKTVTANPVVLSAVILIWSLYFLLLVWANRKDRRLKTKNIVNVLSENGEFEKQRYLVTVATGCRKGSGTTSRVYLQVFGEAGESGPRCLNPSWKSRLLQTGDDDMFLLTTDQSLGELRKISVWHRNDRGVHPNWFLSRIHVIDLRSRESWFFPVSQWLSLGRELSFDAVPSKGGESFALSFNTRAISSLRDGHLWFSILLPPPRNRFNCKQRTTVALCLLLMAMLVNIMFHGTNVTDPDDQFHVHRVRISLSQIVVGIETAIIVFPVGLLICFLFQHSRPREGDRLVFQTMVSDDEENLDSSSFGQHQSERAQASTSVYENEDELGIETKKNGGCCQLPFWFVHVAYFLSYFVSLSASFFVILYGLTYGYERSLDWLVSMITSFFQSVVIIQPVKVFLVALVLTLLFKEPPNRYGDLENYFAENGASIDRNNWPPSSKVNRVKSENGAYSRLSSSVLQEFRYFHGTETKIVFIISEIAVFAVFFASLLVIVYSQLPTSGYYSTLSLKNMLVEASYTKTKTLNDVRDFKSCMEYLNDTLIPSLHATRNFNGAILKDVGYTMDMSTRVVGVIRFRQKRVRNETCSTHLGKRLVKNCHKEYSRWREDKGDYYSRWSRNAPLLGSKLIGRGSGIGRYDPWLYRSGRQLENNRLVHGKLYSYGGGGYVALLGRTRRWSREALKDLFQHGWFDDRTRVLIVEFTTYNANSNLFSIVQIVLEFTADGSVQSNFRVQTLIFFYVKVGLDTAIGLAHAVFVLLLVFLSIREILHVKEYGVRYFKDVWNLLEVFLILCSFGAIVVALKRYQTVSKALSQNDPSTGNKFVNFFPSASWNDTLASLQGILIAASTIKIWKLLSFNRYFSMPYATLKTSSKAILHYLIFMTILLVAGVLFCRLAFGVRVNDMRATIVTLVTIFKYIMGRVSFKSVIETGSLFRGVFFLFFVFFVLFIMMSVFFAILVEATKRARLLTPSRDKPRPEDILEYVAYRFQAVIGQKNVSWVEHMSHRSSKTSPKKLIES